MAIAAIFELPDFSQEQYAKTLTGLEAAGLGSPDGRISHVAAAMDKGLFIVDLWQSEEALGKFAETLTPIIIGAGGTPAEPRIFQVHNTI
jgi:hypothetical protein